jgi:hypothetical protein
VIEPCLADGHDSFLGELGVEINSAYLSAECSCDRHHGELFGAHFCAPVGIGNDPLANANSTETGEQESHQPGIALSFGRMSLKASGTRRISGMAKGPRSEGQVAIFLPAEA